MIKLALIGCGKIGSGVHLPAIQMLSQEELVELVGVCDLDSQRAAAVASRYDVRTHGSDWRQVVRDSNADAIAVCLPPGPNADVSSAAVSMGVHVLCEKPPGRTVADAEGLAAASAQRPEIVTMVAFNRRYAPLYTKALELTKKLGGPNSFYGKFTRGAMGGTPSDTAEDWITSDAAHALDLAFGTIGFPHSAAVHRAKVGMGPDNVWMIQLMGDTCNAFLVLDFAAGRRVERYEWTGAGFDVVLELPDHGEWAQHTGSTEIWQAQSITHSTSPVVNYGYTDEYRVFLKAIRGEGPRPEVDFCYASNYMQAVSAILAASSGSVVQFSTPSRTSVEEVPHDVFPAPTVHAKSAVQPVVTFMQYPSALGKYFGLGDLRALLNKFDVRFSGTQEEIIENLSESHVILTGWDAPALSAEQFDLARNLELVIVIGSSVKLVHPEVLRKKGIAVCNTADAVAKSVAEHCLLLSLAGLRKLTQVDSQMHLGRWPPVGSGSQWIDKAKKLGRRIPGAKVLKPMIPKVLLNPQKDGRGVIGGGITDWADLRGQTIGLVGWGNIASNFAKLLGPFSCTILVYTESGLAQDLENLGAHKASLGEVLGSSKVVSLHRGVTEKTIGMIGERELALLRPGTVLVNTARAVLVDESALLKRLAKGDIVAALDVFSREPLPPGHPLQKMPNAILTPHMSNISNECYYRVGSAAIQLLQDWCEGTAIPVLTENRIDKMT